MSNIDKRIKVNTIIENQLPEFLVTDFPKAAEFLKQYYISQEFQGGASDLINKFDQYLKPDNLVPEVVVGITSITSAISSSILSKPYSEGNPFVLGTVIVVSVIDTSADIVVTPTTTSGTRLSTFKYWSKLLIKSLTPPWNSCEM